SSLKLAAASFTPKASFANQGSANESNVTLRYRILGPQPATTVVYDQTTNLASFAAGATLNVSFPATSIAAGGFYTIEASALLPSDVNTANDLISASFEIGALPSGDNRIGAAEAL